MKGITAIIGQSSKGKLQTDSLRPTTGPIIGIAVSFRRRLQFLFFVSALACALICGSASSASENSSDTFLVFVGGYADQDTGIMFDLYKSINDEESQEFQELKNCDKAYFHWDSTNMAREIRTHKEQNPGSKVILIGHSLGGKTAMNAVQSIKGIEGLVTLDPYSHPGVPISKHIVAFSENLMVQMKLILRCLGNIFDLAECRPKYPYTYWTNVSAGNSWECGGEGKIDGLEAGFLAGSHPISIQQTDGAYIYYPDKEIMCDVCNHCDVRRMFWKALDGVSSNKRGKIKCN